MGPLKKNCLDNLIYTTTCVTNVFDYLNDQPLSYFNISNQL